ncbi:IS4 family transposase [Legionella oakridgensis]|uniref:IS4 family transposase n=1 Tax=Legionella oakridgensis TaxID=29423 RepID=UPI0003DE0A71|nr:IS4 family transposase [Legionella oakridgensis]ETO93838.1 transposase [Legionella oakridgensis RV-2-2007]
MKNISELKGILGQHLGWHKARIDFFARALIGFLLARSINFKEISVFMPSLALIESRYKRIQRFFRDFEIDFIARWLFLLFFHSSDKLYLSIDRTNWFWGRSKINIFMLSICYEGIAIPIYWRLLPKAGHSTGREQIALLKRFIQQFGTHPIEAVLADREFPNKTFISWLQEHNIPFYMRIKHDTVVKIRAKKYKSAGEIFAGLSPRVHHVFHMRLTLFQHQLYLAASKNERNELMIIVTNANPKVALATYLRRWEIECLFQAFKQRGFQFESTQVTHSARLEKMLAFMAIAFAWAHKTGEWQAIKRPIKRQPLKNN